MQVTPIILGGANPLSARLALSGNYFRLLVSTDTLTMRLYRKGRPFSEAANLLAGYWSAPTAGFDEVEVITVNPQTVYIGTADGLGGYDRAAGDFNITGNTGSAVKVSATDGGAIYTIPHLAAITSQRWLATQDGGFFYGATYSTNITQSANIAAQVFSPASNVNGAIVWSFTSEVTNAAAAIRCALLAKASAPASVIDGDPIASSDRSFTLGTAFTSGFKLARATRIPAGKGLYHISDANEATCLRGALYTLL